MSFSKKIIGIVVVILVLAGVAASAYMFLQPKPLETVNVTLDFVPNGQELPFYVGVDRGLFSKYGLDVKVTPSTGSAVAIRALASGKADFIDADIGSLLTVMTHDNITNVKVVSAYFQHSPIAVVYVKGKGINQPKDLENRTISSSAGSANEVLWPIFTKNTGIDLSKVKIMQITPSSCGPSLLTGQFDASICLYSRALVDLEPQATKAGLKLGTFNYTDFGADTLGLGIMTRVDIIQKRPDLVKNFLKGFWEAAQFAAKNPNAGIDSFMKTNPQSDRSLMLGEWQWAMNLIGSRLLTAADPTSAGWIDPTRMNATISIIAEGFKIPKLNASQVYTNEFLGST